MLFAAEPQNLCEILRNLPISTHIASILKQTNDLRSVIGVLQMAFVLLHKMPELFTVQFQRQGVVFQVKKLLEREQSTCANDGGALSTTPPPPAALASLRVLDLMSLPASEANTGSISASSGATSAPGRAALLAPIEKRKKPVPPTSAPFSTAAGELLSTGFLRGARHSARGTSSAAPNARSTAAGQRPLSMLAQMDSSELPATRPPDAPLVPDSRVEPTLQATTSAARTSPMNFLTGVFHRRTSGSGEHPAQASSGLTTFTVRSSSKTKAGEAAASSATAGAQSPRPIFSSASAVIPSIWRSSQTAASNPSQPLNPTLAPVGASRLSHRILKWESSTDSSSPFATIEKLPAASANSQLPVPLSPLSTVPKPPTGPRPLPSEFLDPSVLSLGLIARPLPTSLLAHSTGSGQLRQQIDALATQLRAWIKQHAEQFLRDFDEKCSSCAALIESSSSTIEKLTLVMGKLSQIDADYVSFLHELSRLLISTDISAFELEHSDFVTKLLKFLTCNDDALAGGSSLSTAPVSDTSDKLNNNPGGLSASRPLAASKKVSNAAKARLKLSDAKPPKLERVSEVDSLLDPQQMVAASSSGEGSSATASSSASSTPTADHQHHQQRVSLARVERLRWFLAVLLHDPPKLQQRLCELAASGHHEGNSPTSPSLQPPSLSHSSVSSSTSLVLPFSSVSGEALSQIVLDSRTNGTSLDTNFVHNTPFNRLIALLINLLHYEEQFTLQIVEFRGAQSSSNSDNGNNRLALPTLRVRNCSLFANSITVCSVRDK